MDTLSPDNKADAVLDLSSKSPSASPRAVPSISPSDHDVVSPQRRRSSSSDHIHTSLDTKPLSLGGSLFPSMAGMSFGAGLDPLAMAAAFQSTNPMGLYSTDNYTSSLSSSAPWSYYLSHLSSRKRKAPSQPRTKTEPQHATSGNESPEEKRDDSYWDRRRKNNEAAKRSRDARRQKEEEVALRAAFLEQENLKLRAQVTILKNESAKLHFLLYNRGNTNNLTSTTT